MANLWTLAREREQPDFQYMDQETLEQIKFNKPVFKDSDTEFCFTQKDLDLVLDSAPAEDWYLRKEIISSIHGVAHTIRVMVYAYILAKDEIDQSVLKALLLACAVHDTQRLNDKGDEQHEERALEYFKDKFADNENYELICQILEGTHEYEKYLRTADALDRYRLPKVKWWIDDSYLETKPEESLKSFAFDLIVCSEQRMLQGTDHKSGVIGCLAII